MFNHERSDPELSEHREPRLLRAGHAAAGRRDPANEQGDIDLIFHVKEKRTGNVNFGASVGPGHGRRRLHRLRPAEPVRRVQARLAPVAVRPVHQRLQPQYTDPRIRQSHVSGTVTAVSISSRASSFATSASRTRRGGQLQFGFPLPNSRLTRFFVCYGGEQVKLRRRRAASATINCNGCFRSTLGLTLDHDTRLGTAVPGDGVHAERSRCSSTAARSAERRRSSATRPRCGRTRRSATFGGSRSVREPMTLVLGLSARAGAVFGDPGPFFVSQAFSLGGVQYGEPLRGYEEFSITPNGYRPERRSVPGAAERRSAMRSIRARSSLAFGSISSSTSNAFYDARQPVGAGRATSIRRGCSAVPDSGRRSSLRSDRWASISGTGSIGPTLQGDKDPKWQVHFKLGQIF